ncbi:MAG: RNase adapter RapZ [Oscillospiraceae bacterium]|jgi:UPF0042 nucleotide-binding protein|nr:RNase adapter RapZ [Oscillospiraceae bacterium]
MEFLIITGLSGAGKSRTVAALEDIGYYCVDNVPPSLISKFYQLCDSQDNGQISRVAVVTDIRGGTMFNSIFTELELLTKEGMAYKLVFLDADNDTLIRRFKETRRKHPLSEKYMGAVADAVQAERTALQKVRESADYIIDTTQLSPMDLKTVISGMFLGESDEPLIIHCLSFGFKNGLPPEADMLFDVRCLPNPFYIDELKDLTGLDKEVSEYVSRTEAALGFLERVFNLIDYSMPLYLNEGKCQMTIAFGCTGGKHRSVTMAQHLCEHLKAQGKRVSVTHRDILKK